MRQMKMARVLLIPMLTFGLAGPAEAVDIVMSTDVDGCTGYASGEGLCALIGQSQITVTWELASQETLNGYDLEIRWDASELTLASTAQLLPDCPSCMPFTWLEQPSDPDDSSALVISLTPGATMKLFSLTFDVIDSPPADNEVDLWWFPNGNGLAPGSVVLGNPEGAGIDLAMASVVLPALDFRGRIGLVLLLLAAAAAIGRTTSVGPSA